MILVSVSGNVSAGQILGGSGVDSVIITGSLVGLQPSDLIILAVMKKLLTASPLATSVVVLFTVNQELTLSISLVMLVKLPSTVVLKTIPSRLTVLCHLASLRLVKVLTPSISLNLLAPLLKVSWS